MLKKIILFAKSVCLLNTFNPYISEAKKILLLMTSGDEVKLLRTLGLYSAFNTLQSTSGGERIRKRKTQLCAMQAHLLEPQFCL